MLPWVVSSRWLVHNLIEIAIEYHKITKPDAVFRAVSGSFLTGCIAAIGIKLNFNFTNKNKSAKISLSIFQRIYRS